MNILKGDQLNPVARKAALCKFVHRYTGDHVPRWVRDSENISTPLQFASDEEWLANSEFWVTKEGYLDERFNHCQSNPTWPNNPELRR